MFPSPLVQNVIATSEAIVATMTYILINIVMLEGGRYFRICKIF